MFLMSIRKLLLAGECYFKNSILLNKVDLIHTMFLDWTSNLTFYFISYKGSYFGQFCNNYVMSIQ